MKTIVLLFSTALILIVGCSKKNAPTANPITSVTISGKSYPVVTIGTQLWTAQNYDGPGGVASQYGDESLAGKYYSLSEMGAITPPSGWRVPTKNDYLNLFKTEGSVTADGSGDLILDASGSARLRSPLGWNIGGDNGSGFNALAAGYSSGNVVYEHGIHAFFWTSTPSTSAVPQRLLVLLEGYTTTGGGQNVPITKSSIGDFSGLSGKFSIRFVTDN